MTVGAEDEVEEACWAGEDAMGSFGETGDGEDMRKVGSVVGVERMVTYRSRR